MIKRTTVYLDSRLHRAVKTKAHLSHASVSNVIQQAILLSLKEDKIDLKAIKNRSHEPSRSLHTVIRGLKRDGLL